jgi:hypothetical protein
VNAAAICAEAVYERDGEDRIPSFPEHIVKAKHWIPPSKLGTIKCSILFEVESVTSETQTTLLIAAVRGSDKAADWLVNLNNKLVPCPDIIVSFQSRVTGFTEEL